MAESHELNVSNDETTAGQAPTRIGVLFVHGIGEQKRFEHLENEARGLARALQDSFGKDAVTVTIRTRLDGARHADQMTWRADGVAPVQIRVKNADKNSEIELSEVWWADLDERSTLGSRLGFWFWALGQWWEVGRRTETADLTDLLVNPSEGKSYPWLWIRFQLFFVASVFFSLFALSLYNVAARVFRVGKVLPLEIFSNYLGDVKLLVQAGRNTAGTLEDLGLPPRVSIRRRMMRMLVEMASRDYERWYIFAHSLGTVVAQNGLNEMALCLANYLDQETWDIHEASNGLAMRPEDGPSADDRKMMPRRPPWLHPQDAIDRTKLFDGLRGVVTYGSPLDKFSALWPWIVGVNDKPAFKDCIWVNVYDPTDPVSGFLDDFGEPPDTPTSDFTTIEPRNFAVYASPILLLSHIRYFTHKTNGANKLATHAANWLLDGENINFLSALDSAEPSECCLKWRSWWKYLQWVVAQAVFATALGYILYFGYVPFAENLGHLLNWIQWVPDALRPAIDWWITGTLFSFAVVLLAGIAIRLKRL